MPYLVFSICVKIQKDSQASTISHRCFKNWDGTSTSMESDIILEGFNQSITMHNLIYHKLIGDGDFKKVEHVKTLWSKFSNKNIECKNHISRNYMNRINDIAGKRKSSSGTVVPAILRKILKDNTFRLRYGITKAIDHWKNAKNLTINQKFAFLKRDIENGPYHVFGSHDEYDPSGKICSQFICIRRTFILNYKNCFQILL
uniref:Mutator-like transposase domain-containing protein n=1 Tax=Sipha flava TaxID=143950 RepID=A0A2S2R0S1_9HEMI